jgi:ERCC4-type nuclease
MVSTIIVDVYEPKQLAIKLNATVKPLLTGDFLLTSSTKSVTIERKTWDDAYGSWQSLRLEAQIAAMLAEDTDAILIIEGNPSDAWVSESVGDVSDFLAEVNGTKVPQSNNRYKQLRKFLMRMNVEVLPVVFTDSIDETVAYIKSLAIRLDSGDYQYLVRKVTVVKSSRNVYHNMLQLIPGISIERCKQLYSAADNFQDLILNWERIATSVDEKTRWQNTAKRLTEFWNAPWNVSEREVILRKQ